MSAEQDDWEKLKLREELAAAYERIAAMGADVFWSRHYQEGKANGTIIDIDFPVRPRARDFRTSPHMKRLTGALDNKRDTFKTLLQGFSERHGEGLRAIPLDQPEDAGAPYWINGWLPGLDGVSIYSFIIDRKPKIYFEVGSGNSTKFARRAISDAGLSTRIVSIDPHPRAEIDAICDEMHRVGFEEFNLDLMSMLSEDDVVFIDNSHRSFSSSDVTVFFMEALGRIPKGCLYGIHDIFLPADYPDAWARDRFYSEQYVLAAYLFGGADGDEIVLPCGYVSHTPDLLAALDPLWQAKPGILKHGGAFWMSKA